MIELLVVMAVIGVIVAVLLPAIQAVRESARRAHCSSHFKQIGLGLLNYENVHQVFPPAFTRGPDHNLLTFVLPFVEQRNVYEKYNFARDWRAAENREAREAEIAIFVCPTSPSGRKHVSDYAACTQVTSTVWRPMVTAGRLAPRSSWIGLFQPYAWRCTPSAGVSDGLSNTFLLFEDGGRPQSYRLGRLEPGRTITGAAWADSGASFWMHNVCNGTQLINCSNNNEIFGFHPGGCNFLYADGSVHFHPESMDADPFVALFTSAAGDVAR